VEHREKVVHLAALVRAVAKLVAKLPPTEENERLQALAFDADDRASTLLSLLAVNSQAA
jgi:hypothetical protein